MDIKELKEITNPTRAEEVNEVYYEIADYLKRHDAMAYKRFLEKAEDIVYHIDQEWAEGIVMSMTPYGQRWSMGEVRSILAEHGIAECEDCKYYLAMNMAYNDYRRTAEKYGLDRPDFYYDVAYDFINDEDGKSHKVAKYFM